MQSFKFRLDRVLRWQFDICRLKEGNVRTCRLAVHAAEEAIACLQVNRLAAEQTIRNESALPGPDLHAWARYFASLDQKRRELQAELRGLARALEEAVSQLMAERRRLRQIELIRCRALREHTLALEREIETVALESHLSKRVSSSADASVGIPAS